MKSFFEEYGLVILGILAVIVLICMVSPLGEAIQTSLTSIQTKFKTSVETAMDNAFTKVGTAHTPAPVPGH